MLNFFIFIRATLRNFYYFINFTFLIFGSFNFTFTESLKGFEMKPTWVFSDSPRDKNFRGFPSVKNHWWFKLEETFSGFLIQFARQDIYGFSLRVNNLWFKLEKNPFCVLPFYIIGGSRHLLTNLYRNLSGLHWHQLYFSNKGGAALK